MVGIGWAFVAAEAPGLVLRMEFVRRLFPGRALLVPLARAVLPAAIAGAGVLAVHAIDGGERSPALTLTELLGYAAATVAATLLLERSLLREALGYLQRRASNA